MWVTMLWTQPAYLRLNTNPRTFGNVPHVLLERSPLGEMSLSPTLRATRKGTTSRGTSRRLPGCFLSSLPVAFVREECEGAPSHTSHTSYCLHLNLRFCLSLYRAHLFVRWSSTPPTFCDRCLRGTLVHIALGIRTSLRCSREPTLIYYKN